MNGWAAMAAAAWLLPAGAALAAAHGPVQAIPAEIVAPLRPTPVTAEGRRHLLYELQITNLGHAELHLERLEVLDDAGGGVLASYAGDGLKAILSRPGVPGLADRRAIGGGLRAVAFIEVILPASSRLPVKLRQRLTFQPVTLEDEPEPQTVADRTLVEVDPAPPLVIGPPLRGGGWVALNGLSNTSSHRRTVITLEGHARISQRYAIDWTRIGPDGQAFRGDPADNANWSPYGADVLAVADGRIVDLQDGIPENDPTSDAKATPITYETAAGDYLVLDIGHGRYALYAHLKPGSLRVKLGERVRRGAVIASVGDSGKADAPHLHFHITDGPSPFAAEGVAFVFDAFDLEGHVPSLKVLTDGTGWRPSGPASARRRELPVQDAVVGFSEK